MIELLMRAKDVIAFAKSHGWRFIRYGARASHRIYRHAEPPFLLSIPAHSSKDLARGTLSRILKQIEGAWRPK